MRKATATQTTPTPTPTPAPEVDQAMVITAAEVLNVSEEFLDGAEAGYAVREAIRERTDKAKGFVAALFMRKNKEPKAKKEARVIPPHVLAMLGKK